MNKTLNFLFIIYIIGLAVSILIFILIAIFSDRKKEMIVLGLLCCILSNLFNILRSMQYKSKQ